MFKVKGETKNYHWMIKLPPGDPARVPLHKAIKAEEKEIGFYDELLSAYKKLISDL